MNETVSVIIPVYKVEKYLDRCVESVVNQTYKNLEIILVDDGSPDNCPQMCDAWAQKDARIKVIHKENAGLGMARNSGLEMATGEFIMFIDSDDWISERAAEVFLQRLLADGTDMAVCHIYYAYDGDRIDEAVFTKWMTDTVVRGNELFNFRDGKNWSVSAWNKMYKRGVLSGIKYPILKCGEDLWVYPQIVNNCNKVSLISEPLVFYYQRAESITNSMTEERRIDELTATLNMLKALCKNSDNQSVCIWFKRAVQQAFNITSSSQIGMRMLRDNFKKDELKYLIKLSKCKVRIKLMVMKVPMVFQVWHYIKSLIQCAKRR